LQQSKTSQESPAIDNTEVTYLTTDSEQDKSIDNEVIGKQFSEGGRASNPGVAPCSGAGVWAANGHFVVTYFLGTVEDSRGSNAGFPGFALA
jgi:hypothetical protein